MTVIYRSANPYAMNTTMMLNVDVNVDGINVTLDHIQICCVSLVHHTKWINAENIWCLQHFWFRKSKKLQIQSKCCTYHIQCLVNVYHKMNNLSIKSQSALHLSSYTHVYHSSLVLNVLLLLLFTIAYSTYQIHTNTTIMFVCVHASWMNFLYLVVQQHALVSVDVEMYLQHWRQPHFQLASSPYFLILWNCESLLLKLDLKNFHIHEGKCTYKKFLNEKTEKKRDFNVPKFEKKQHKF